MSKKWLLYAGIAVVAIPVWFLLARADRDAPKGETRVCSWSFAAIDVRSVPALTGGPSGGLCDLSAAGVKFSFKVFEATEPNAVVNVPALKQYYKSATEASKSPAFDVSPAKLLSLSYLLFGNRAPITIYSAPDRKRGFLLAELTDTLVIVGLWTSDQPIKASQISDLVRIRINPAGNEAGWAIWVKLIYLILTLLACLPLGLVWYSKATFRSIDQWLNVRTMIGLMVYAGLIPAALLGFVWVVFFFVGWSTGLLLSSILTVIALIQIAFRLVADRGSKLPLTPFNSPDPKIFDTLRGTTGKLDVLGAEVPISHSVDLQMWCPRHFHCSGCGMEYVVYVPAKSSQSVSHEISKASEISSHTLRQLYSDAIKAAPQLVNGCIRCGLPRAGSSPNLAIKRDEPFTVDAKYVIITLVAFALAIAVRVFSTPISTFCEKLPFAGGLLSYIFDDLSGLVVFFLTLPLFFLIWHVVSGFADRNAKHGTGPYRMSACPKEGIVFEDIAAERDSKCPSCGGQLEPLRRFRTVAGSSTSR